MSKRKVIAWVRSGVLDGAPELVKELGGNPSDIARQAGLRPKALRDPELPIMANSVVRYLEIAADECACPSFGLRLGQRQELSLFGPLWPLFRSADTIDKLLQDLADYFPLHTRGALLSRARVTDGIMVVYDLASGVGKSRRQVIELGLSVLVSEIRRHQPRWRPSEVLLRHAPPDDLRVHRQLLCNNIQFNADRNAIFVERSLLAQPTVTGDASEHGKLAAQLAGTQRDSERAAVTRAEVVVRALLPFAPCTLDATARMMRLTRRTLQRRLTEAGTSFDEIVDEVRADLAASFLTDSDLSVAAVAEILQYSQTSALSRAYRRWYGAGPRAARKSGV